jgi:peptide/nickel transport system permease protein
MNKLFIKALSKRILTSVTVLFFMISFIFFLVRISPGDPALKYLSPNLPPQAAEKIKESFDLNSTIINQYKSFLINMIRGDMGISYTHRRPVSEVILEYLPFTIILSLLSFILQAGGGILLALFSIKKINGFLDRSFSKLSILAYALPPFVIGVFLIFIFSEKLGLFPSSGLNSYDFESKNFIQQIGDYLHHLTLPLITLSLGGIALFYKYLRDNLEDIYNSTFVMNLRASGVDEKIIRKKHIIPNALGPFISIGGIELGILFSGALITEVIFGLPGMGRLTISAIFDRDYPLIVGAAFTSGMLVLISNLTADLIKAKIDKRFLTGI